MKSNIKGWQDRPNGSIVGQWAFGSPLHGAWEKAISRVTIRLDDSLSAAIDAAAERAGLSRSAFIKRELAAATDARADDRRDGGSDDNDRVRIQVRIGKKQHRALAEDAARQHLLPSDIVRKLIHARYYDGGESALFYSKDVREAAFSIRAEINPIGRNVNTAARHLMAAVNDGDPREMIECAQELDATRGAVMSAVEKGQRAIEQMAAADSLYWRSVK
ncbi:ribbon-helix-helix protein, CopG family [Erythrobacter sp. LQ02-29]|uniref:ribbon-helix-helix protein, CopG family n=1 Tax=Erythrobacter sp. LQ02-29 TaxID=2920384 RepID=UPI001F4D5961|nr:ribbon-helix-helix protein, CopG family [Erythrobacter sp. LQ02-29]MCP9223885.1 ribbon-helix-helix protein, CopG family [Erythrobacter sp. LQ02-29]